MIISPLFSSPPVTVPPASSGRDQTAAPGAGRSSPAVSAERESPMALTEVERRQLDKLKARDREVRAHEAAHQSVGGQYAGAASYTYQRGPDGVQYAVGGEVPIELSAVEGDPQATVEKMRTVQAAALAPAQPSAQDRAVAAEAAQIRLQAEAEMAQNAKASRERTGDGQGADGRAAVEAYRSISAMSSDASDGARAGFQLRA